MEILIYPCMGDRIPSLLMMSISSLGAPRKTQEESRLISSNQRGICGDGLNGQGGSFPSSWAEMISQFQGVLNPLPCMRSISAGTSNLESSFSEESGQGCPLVRSSTLCFIIGVPYQASSINISRSLEKDRDKSIFLNLSDV